MKKILAISGSTRKSSANEAILRAIAKAYDNKLDVLVYDQLDELPHFNPDTDKEGAPPPVKKFRERIRQADGVIICTPEYVFSLPGVLKNALEWTVSTIVFTDKPVAFVVASASGEKAYESLDLILTTLQASIGDRSRLLIRGPRGKMNEAGEFSDKKVLEDIDVLINSLIHTIENKRSTSA